MLPNMNPRQMQQMLKQMGINSRQLTCSCITIESEDEKIIITEPQVFEIAAQGQKSYLISGKTTTSVAIREEDIKLVVEQTNCTEEQALETLKKTNGDIVQAIMNLKK